MTAVIKTNNLTKKYGSKIAANNVSLTVNKGDIYGLIGRNGAGKTTIMKMIAKLINPSSGSFEISSLDSTRPSLGILIESPGLYLNFNARKNLELKFAAEGISSKGKIEPLLELVGLKGVKKNVKGFSLGMKQRLGLAIALVGDPEILLLDEPTNGMDPQGMREFRELIKKLVKERNLTVIISSHILEELSKTANRFGIIEDGKLIKEFERESIDNSTRSRIEIVVDNLEQAKVIIEQNFEGVQVLIVEDKLNIIGEFSSKEINKILCKHDIFVDQIYKTKESLEDFYIDITGGANV